MSTRKTDNPILVPVDFSAHSEAAVVKAAEMADKLKTSLVLLHVVHDPSEAPGYYAIKGQNKQLRRMEDVAGDMLSEFLARVGKSHSGLKALKSARSMLVTGLPVTRILEISDKLDCQMIIMGSQGRTGLSHVLLGSKAEQVVRLSSRPVMIVKTRAAKQSGSGK